MRKEEKDGLLVNRLEIHAGGFAAESHAELVDHEGAAVGNRDPAPDASRAQVFAALEHLEEHSFGLLVQLQQTNQLAKDVVFRNAFELELDGIFGEELA